MSPVAGTMLEVGLTQPATSGHGPAARVELLGIRHHGPGSAGTLQRALDELQPDAVLVELPSDTAEVLHLAADPDMVPPVALLGYVADHPERAAFYPLARFSPEWVAARWAHEHGVAPVPIDLPLDITLGDGGHGRLAGVDAIRLLADAAGYDDPERWWEDLVEHRGGEGALDGFAAIAEAMTAVRATAPPESRSEAAREASMREGIRRAVRAGHRRVAVVCGAWHVPALATWEEVDRSGADARLSAGRDRRVKAAKVAVTWVPWAHHRLATASGYGAGVASPGWYDHVFSHSGPEVVVRWFTRAAQLLRSADHPVSPEHVIAASRLATALAALRQRPAPGLKELLDAADAVLADGRTGPLALIHDQLVVGDQLGSVPARTPMVPLARDLLAAQRKLRLRPEAGSRVLELDVRSPLGRGRSHLLHRLAALGVHWGRPAESRGSSGTFRETWTLRWEPELELLLIEASSWGTTLTAASSARLRDRAAASDTLLDLTGLVEVALLADLPDAVEALMAALSERAALEGDVSRLLDALGPLARALRYGDVRGTDASALARVVDGLILRVVVGLPAACRGLDDDSAAAMAERITAGQSALALLDHAAREQDWPRTLTILAEQPTVAPAVQGRAARLLHDAGRWSADKVGVALSAALSVGTPPARGAAFVEGFLAGSGTVLLHDRALLDILDRWVIGLSADAFVDVAPLLRRTFGAFDVAERRQLGQLLSAQGDGRPVAPYGWDLDDDRVGAALATVAALLGVGAGPRRDGGRERRSGPR